MKNDVFLMLDFLSVIDEKWMLSLFQVASKEFGKELVEQVIKVRSTLPNEKFTTVEQLYSIDGLGKEGVNMLLSVMNTEPKYPGMLKGRETFTFSKAPVIPKPYLKQIILEATGADFKGKKERTYLLYYKPELKKEEVHEVVKSLTGFVSSQNDRIFLIQNLDNTFVAAQTVAPGSIYKYGPKNASRFRIYDEKNPAYPNLGNTNLTNSEVAVAFEYENSNYPFLGGGILRFDSASNKVIGGTLSQGQIPTSDQYFDISGIIGRPHWASPKTFKSFTIMTHAAQTPSPNDPREFIQIGSTSFQSLEGTNQQAFWRGKTGFRYVEVIEDVCLRTVHNQSHTGVEKDNMYLHVDNGVIPSTVSTQYFASGATNLPQNIFFDLHIFYGYWDYRDTISCKIMLRGKIAGKGFLQVDSNDTLRVGGNNMQDYFLFLEKGWGENNNNVFLKTTHGKYLKSWNNVVSAASVDRIGHEQWEIIFP